LTLVAFLGCSTVLRNPLNRPMRTRMSGGVAGESGRPLPLCRFGLVMFRMGESVSRPVWGTSQMKMIRGMVTALYCVLFLALFVANSRATRLTGSSHAEHGDDPWFASQTVLPADLAKELAAPAHPDEPAVVCAGFRPLYRGAHIPRAVFHGAASTDQGLAELKKWAQTIPKATNVVLYCGCCPLAHCPNLRPAFVAMRDMGFTNLRVLILPNDFNTDWIEKGYPVEKGR
jgi:thiosulfate/3-mercaptopyruvate sulfurtransferase